MYHHCFNYSLCSAAVHDLWHSLNKDLSLTLIPSRVFTVRQLAETAAAVATAVAAAITAVRASGFDIHVEWRRHICVSLQECVGALTVVTDLHEVEHLAITSLSRSVCGLEAICQCVTLLFNGGSHQDHICL